MLFKLSNLNANRVLTLAYLNPALNNSTLIGKSTITFMARTQILVHRPRISALFGRRTDLTRVSSIAQTTTASKLDTTYSTGFHPPIFN